MDPLQWMGAVRMTVQTADKNSTITPISSSSINILSSKKLHVCKKQIHYWGTLTLNCCFWPKYHSIIHNVYFSEKVLPLVSSHIKIYWHICLELFWAVFTCKQCLICVFLSAVWTLILTAPIHCRGSIVDISSTSWMAWGWVHFQSIQFTALFQLVRCQDLYLFKHCKGWSAL